MEAFSFAEASLVEVDDGFAMAELAAGERCSVLYYRVDPGVSVAEHRHEHEQLGMVLAGEFTFVVDGEAVTVGPNDTYAIDAGEAHAAENRSAETVEGVDIFSPPRTKPDWAAWYESQRE